MKRNHSVIIIFLSLVLAIGAAFGIGALAAEDALTLKTSVTMSDSLIFNVYVPKLDKVTAIEVDGQDKPLESLGEKDGYYLVKIPLYPKDAARSITVKVTVTEGDTRKVGTFEISVVKYASSVINGDSYTTTEKTLVKDMLAYINSAAVYAGGNASASILEVLGSYEGSFSPGDEEKVTAGLTDATFVLGPAPSVRFYLDKGYSPEDFSFSQDGEPLSATFGSDDRGDYLQIRTYAFRIAKTFEFTVRGEGGYKYNLASYVSFAENEYSGEKKQQLVDLAKKLYIYSESAAEYRREVIISLCEHTYESTVIKKATATEKGIMEKYCDKCTHKYEEAIPTTLKILAIGNSFSEDAFAHLYLAAKDAGIENIVLGNLYKGGCSLSTHYTKMINDDPADYIFYVSSDKTGGMVKDGENATRTARYAITYTDWDYITIQQASTFSGVESSYSNLDGVIDFINANKTGDAKILWHMTWAYQQNSTHSGFANYGNSQTEMYNAIVSTVKSKILTNSKISGVIPSGTAIQNLRTSTLGDTVTRDGYHLSHGIGRYTAALTYLAYVTGIDIDKITATPTGYKNEDTEPSVKDYLPHIKDAVKKAIADPFAVTESAYPGEPAADVFPKTTLSPLTEADKSYLTSIGKDPEGYMVLDLSIVGNSYYNSSSSSKYAVRTLSSGNDNQIMKWMSTQIFTRNELISGSIIKLSADYRYRADGWLDMEKNASKARPDTLVNTTTSPTYVEITESWWLSKDGAYEFNYRAFNIGIEGQADYTQSEFDAFEKADSSSLPMVIYVPVVKRAPLNADDKSYLLSAGLDPDEYMRLDFDYTVDWHYNSTMSGGAVSKPSTGNTLYRFIAVELLSKYDLTEGSVIMNVGEKHSYRPDGWVNTESKTANSVRPATTSAALTVVDSAWWGDFNYRGINIQKTDGTEQNPVTASDASALLIYVKLPEYERGIYEESSDYTLSELTAEDVAYLEGLGKNASDYKVLDLVITENAYYRSDLGSNIRIDGESSSVYHKYLATRIFTKDELTLGSIIRIDSGYKYRPEAWTSLDKKNSSRPGNVSKDGVEITESWWGSYNYRAFNIGRSDGGLIYLSERVNFKIYIKVN